MMKNRNRNQFGKKIKYNLDEFISKGVLAQILLLAGTALILTLTFGVIAMRFGEDNYVESYWTSLMHMIDQGTITADERGTDEYFMFMLIVTFVGMAFTSTIIAIISSGIQGKLEQLRKGHSGIVEKDHIVILGFDENACIICREIAEGSSINGDKVCVVVADDLPKAEMEHGAKEHQSLQRISVEKASGIKIKNRKVKLLFRSGDPVSDNTLQICAVRDARAIVINRDSDIETIRILLGVVGYLKKNNLYLDSNRMPSIVAVIHDADNRSAALAAAEIDMDETDPVRRKNQSRIRIMQDDKMLESLFANTSVQQGLATVMDGLFNYRGSSICIESDDEFNGRKDSNPFIGKTITEISDMVAGAIPLGFAGNDADKSVIVLNPNEEFCYKPEDRLIYLSEKNKLEIGHREKAEPIGMPAEKKTGDKKKKRNILFVGWNYAVPGMLQSISKFCVEGSKVTVITSDISKTEEIEKSVFDIDFIQCDNPYHWGEIKRILEQNSFWFDQNDSRYLTNIIPLSSDVFEKTEADEKVMVILLNIRKYLREKGISNIALTSEMRVPQNQKLLQNSCSNDFIVTTDITNRMVAQITEDTRKHRIIEDLIEQEKYIIELNPITDYLDCSKTFNFEGVFREIRKQGNEIGEAVIPIGWIHMGQENILQEEYDNGEFRMVLNPSAAEREKCWPGGNYEDYKVIILKNR